MSYIKVKLTGLNIDKAVRDMQKNGICLRDLVKPSPKELIFRTDFAKKDDLIALFKETCYNIKILEEKSFQKMLFDNKKRFGLIFGLVLIMTAALLFFPGRYSIKISGNENIPSAEIEKVLDSYGINKGFFKKSADVSQIRNAIFSEFPQVSNVIVYEKGVCLFVEITEENLGSSINSKATGDIYSKVSGTVEKIIVYSGTPLVKTGDKVESGDILIQGDLITETSKKRVRANGEVVLKVNLDMSFDCTDYFIKQVIKEKQTKTRKVVFFDPFAPKKRIEYTEDGYAEISIKRYISENYFLPFYVEETTYYTTENVIVMQNQKEVALSVLTGYMDDNYGKSGYRILGCACEFIKDERVFAKLTGECYVNPMYFVEDK